ncbi:MAG: hypothetical protein OIF58_04855, partial [Cohaesibacter sp.]|nr:hypothetical protein [Cohaesibacter sp.]
WWLVVMYDDDDDDDDDDVVFFAVCVCTFSKEVKLVPVLDDEFLVEKLLIGIFCPCGVLLQELQFITKSFDMSPLENILQQGHWAFLGKPSATKLCLGRGSMT